MKKKNSLIVGGSKGIGSVIASILKKRGDSIFILSRNRIKNSNHIQADLLDKKALKIKLLQKFKKKKIDNIIFSQRYRGTSWLENFQISLFSVEFIIKILKKRLNKNSSVIIISSVSNRTILDDQPSSYHMTRGALENLSKYYAVNYGKHKIRFNCILPTKIIKPENKKFFNSSKKGKNIKKFMKMITPLNEMGTSEDVAYTVEFLTSDKSKFITGQSIVIDGGTSLQSQESILNIKR